MYHQSLKYFKNSVDNQKGLSEVVRKIWTQAPPHTGVYLRELQDGFQAKRVIKDCIGFYNAE